jgi:tRNA(fMet)-specific endonuclease VapC
MSLFVLDTDTLVLFQEGHATVCQRLLSQPLDDLAVTVISVEEQLSGWYTLLRRSRDSAQLARAYQRLADTTQLLGRFPILSFTESAIQRFEELKSLKLTVRHMDLRIAAITLEHGGTLVTRNVRDFRGIPSLVVEDWSAGY